MDAGKTRVFVAGHRGMVGSALVRQLESDPEVELILRSRRELDLTNQLQVLNFFQSNRIDQVYLAAAKVGGILANSSYPAEFIYQNLMIECNVINSAFLAGVRKLMFLGSSCIYPKMADQPMCEEALLTGPLEPTNEPYAIAKIAGIKLCESYNRQYGESHGVDFRSLMPTNLYGPGDNYHLEDSHVIPALIRRFHAAKCSRKDVVEIWGSGSPMREFLYVDDLATASVHVMNVSKRRLVENAASPFSHINVGSGEEISIIDLATLIAKIIRFEGSILADISKPDGAPRKLIDSGRLLNLGWRPVTSMEVGIGIAYSDFLSNNPTKTAQLGG